MAMIQALWNSEHQDLIDLITPFVLYGVGKTTKAGQKIDIDAVRKIMEDEFGYEAFPIAVIKRALQREYAHKQSKIEPYIKKQKKDYFLVQNIADNNTQFISKRMICKEHVGDVVGKIKDYFNERKVNKRDSYTTDEIENYLLNFIEEQGGAIINSIDDLRRILSKNNEINYCLGRFILYEYEQKSVLFDYIEELVNGYFVTAALYIQPENDNITTALFKDVTFYIDTRLLLAFLGYKDDQENESTQKMIKSLYKSGARLACFQYNIDEIRNILLAYRQSITTNFKNNSYITLEYFDKCGFESSYVDIALMNYEKRLAAEGIEVINIDDFTSDIIKQEEYNCYLNEEKIKDKVREFKNNYNMSTLPDDIWAINSVNKIRKGKKQLCIEKCKAVFVTTNIILVWAVKDYLKSENIEVGFPLAITGDDLCVLAWLKDFNKDNSLPQMRFMENVMASLKPSKMLLDKYFGILDELEKNRKISEECSTLLRIDIFAKRELMDFTNGEKENVNENLVMCIKEKITEESYKSGYEQGKRQFEEENVKKMEEKINLTIKKKEEEMDYKYKTILKKWKWAIKIVLSIISVLLISATVINGIAQKSALEVIAWGIITVISLIQTIDSLFGSKKRILKYVEKVLNKKKEKKLDKIRREILDLWSN